MKKLETKNIIIDTSIFIDKNFQYKNGVLNEIVKMVIDRQLNIFSHEIIDQEVKSHIIKEVNIAKASINKVKSEAKILWNMPNEATFAIFNKNDFKKLEVNLIDQYEEFIKITNLH
jgi:hypothetical protein